MQEISLDIGIWNIIFFSIFLTCYLLVSVCMCVCVCVFCEYADVFSGGECEPLAPSADWLTPAPLNLQAHLCTNSYIHYKKAQQELVSFF